ncbi:hypothetical protein SDRG_02788 [Saprolegnia diclina VS20]|uniref:Vesicle transport protein n=1 Tax=Saprolegnia diclina (strain VS20) TaxID=1156394 RepID=T0S4W9_SAPDV|nr:hypothetical protein SDRG_02788 [Saprolegnia diclina VS20]EQC40138.1 hypothetical protein SDRG_02788 [Saprolegnia diclina VS20]|eukprot:XP_008606612.1 hypothetical protein SDRG_02788 [Saprolegnia diclina VS20]
MLPTTLKESFLRNDEAPAQDARNTHRFLMTLGLGLVLFLVSFFVLPLSMAAFGVLYSFGSLIIMLSTLFLAGPRQQWANLQEKNRLPCFTAYLSTIGLTLVFALCPGLWFRSIFVFFSVFVQCCALTWYCLSYFPKAQAGLRACLHFAFG